jgi:hypothetical protein
LVVAGGVEGQLAQEFSGDGVDDADVQVVDQQDDVGSGVGTSDADVVEAAVQAQGDDAGGVDAGVGTGVTAAGGQGGVDGCGGGAVWQGPVRAVVVAGAKERPR